MDTLKEIRSWMNFMGWSDGGNPGSFKRNADGSIVARHGDTTWINDVQDACDRTEREAAKAEVLRRENLRGVDA